MNCKLCQEPLNIKKDKCVHVEDWDRGKQLTDIWCHIVCFNKSMNRELTELERNAKGIIAKAGRVLESDMFQEMFPERKKEYIIQ